jgi:hypothetical protein
MIYCASRPSPVSMPGLKIVLKIGYIIHEPFLRIDRAPPITSCVPPSQLTETLAVQVDNFSTRRGKGNFQKAVVYGIENGRYCVVHNIRYLHLPKLLGCRTARHLFPSLCGGRCRIFLEPPITTFNGGVPHFFDKYPGTFFYFRTRHILVPMENDLAQCASTLQRQLWNCGSTKIQKLKPGSIEARDREEQAKILQRLLRTQPANTLSPRPTPPAGTAHSRVRRVHSRAHSVPRQTRG